MSLTILDPCQNNSMINLSTLILAEEIIMFPLMELILFLGCLVIV